MDSEVRHMVQDARHKVPVAQQVESRILVEYLFAANAGPIDERSQFLGDLDGRCFGSVVAVNRC